MNAMTREPASGAADALRFRLIRVLRRVLPASVRRRVRMLLFDWLDLSWITPTGVAITLGNYGDWVVYNEIFVSGEYDQALSLAFDAAHADGRPLQIVDVGANTGFFTLRAVDRIRRRGWAGRGLSITAIEGHPQCVETYRKRVFQRNQLEQHATLVHGLAGRRTGAATLYEDIVRVSSSTSRRKGISGDGRPARGVRVSYVDLSALFASTPRIDLLKCDIEGSEQLFIETYADVLAKVQVAVFELHRNLCDTDRCQALLREYGFTHHAIFRAGDPYFTYGVWR